MESAALREGSVNKAASLRVRVDQLTRDFESTLRRETALEVEARRSRGLLCHAGVERDILSGQVDSLTEQVTTLETQLDVSNNVRDAALTRVTALERDLATSNGERDSSNRRAANLQDSLTRSEASIAAAKLHITDLEAEVASSSSSNED